MYRSMLNTFAEKPVLCVPADAYLADLDKRLAHRRFAQQAPVSYKHFNSGAILFCDALRAAATDRGMLLDRCPLDVWRVISSNVALVETDSGDDPQ